MGTSHSTPEGVIAYLQVQFDRDEGVIAHRLVASSVHGDGDFTVIWTTHRGGLTYGKSWNIHRLHSAFAPNDAETLAGAIWWGEIDEPNGEGYQDVARARGLVTNPQDVRWLGLPPRSQ